MVIQREMGLGVYLKVKGLLSDVDVLPFNIVGLRCGPKVLLYAWKKI